MGASAAGGIEAPSRAGEQLEAMVRTGEDVAIAVTAKGGEQGSRR